MFFLPSRRGFGVGLVAMDASDPVSFVVGLGRGRDELTADIILRRSAEGHTASLISIIRLLGMLLRKKSTYL